MSLAQIDQSLITLSRGISSAIKWYDGGPWDMFVGEIGKGDEALSLPLARGDIWSFGLLVKVLVVSRPRKS